MSFISTQSIGWAGLVAAVVALGCACQKTPVEAEAVAPQNSWIEAARRVAVRIPSESHGVERDRALADTATVALELGAAGQAEEIVGEISGWRRGELYARLAGRCYGTLRIEAGDRLVGLAQAAAREASLEKWQQSRVNLAVERARQARPSEAASSAADVGRLESADQASLLPDLVRRSVTASNLNETLTRLETVTNQVLELDAATATAEAYRVLYQSQSCSTAETAVSSERILAGIRGVSASLHPAIACEKLIDFGEAALVRHDTSLVAQVCGEIDGRLGGVRDDMKVAVLTRYARFLSRAGQDVKGRSSLEAAEGLLDAPSLLKAELPLALARIGSAWQDVGVPYAARACYRKSLGALAGLANARPRAVSAVQVCLVFARAGVADPALAEALQAVQEGLGEPW